MGNSASARQTVEKVRGMDSVETQADNLRQELVAELLDENDGLWEDEDLVKLEPPPAGKMVRVRVTGQAVFYVGCGGQKAMLLDPNGY
jgi:hypothetical protein